MNVGAKCTSGFYSICCQILIKKTALNYPNTMLFESVFLLLFTKDLLFLSLTSEMQNGKDPIWTVFPHWNFYRKKIVQS